MRPPTAEEGLQSRPHQLEKVGRVKPRRPEPIRRPFDGIADHIDFANELLGRGFQGTDRPHHHEPARPQQRDETRGRLDIAHREAQRCLVVEVEPQHQGSIAKPVAKPVATELLEPPNNGLIDIEVLFGAEPFRDGVASDSGAFEGALDGGA